MNDQPELIRSLLNPHNYPHPTTAVELRETHSAWVLLTGDIAYKIKKPVNLGFLDFSTLEKRHQYCQQELRKNQRLAAHVYLDVVGISGSPSRPVFDGGGTIIEYAIKMRQFPPDDTFDQLLRHQRLTEKLIVETARTVALFHRQAAIVDQTTDFGEAERTMTAVRENFSGLNRAECSTLQKTITRLNAWSESRFLAIKPLMTQRKVAGFIREGHGDLHLGNIALIDDKAVPFDCIEFNPDFYWIDVVNDIAFLIMDLQYRSRADLAFIFLNTYLQETGDYGGLALLPFYCVYRAMVRSKVCAIRQTQQTQEATTEKNSEVAGYIELADRFTHRVQPRLILMHGVSGSGKSWLAQRISARLPGICIRSDRERKRLFAERSPDPADTQNQYSAAAIATVYRRIIDLANGVLDAGFHTIVDATFLQRGQRDAFRDMAAKKNVPLTIVQTHCDEQTTLERLQVRREDAENISDADAAVWRHQQQTIEPLTPQEQKLTLSIDTGNAAALSSFWDKLCNQPFAVTF